ncbi:hypothetical protein ACLOJK_002027 [Asimina triloba]
MARVGVSLIRRVFMTRTGRADSTQPCGVFGSRSQLLRSQESGLRADEYRDLYIGPTIAMYKKKDQFDDEGDVIGWVGLQMGELVLG